MIRAVGIDNKEKEIVHISQSPEIVRTSTSITQKGDNRDVNPSLIPARARVENLANTNREVKEVMQLNIPCWEAQCDPHERR